MADELVGEGAHETTRDRAGDVDPQLVEVRLGADQAAHQGHGQGQDHGQGGQAPALEGRLQEQEDVERDRKRGSQSSRLACS